MEPPAAAVTADLPAGGDRAIRTGWSLAFRAALAMAAFLVLLAGAAVAFVEYDPEHVSLVHSLGVTRAAIVVGLAIVIPFVVYLVVRNWMQVEGTRYRDVQSAWNAGIEALERARIDITGTPLYLYVGFETERSARAYFGASGTPFTVVGAPDRPAPLYWFANPDGIHLACCDAGVVSALSGLVHRALEDTSVMEFAQAVTGGAGDTASPVGRGTAMGDGGSPRPAVGTAVHRTIDVDEYSEIPPAPQVHSGTVDFDRSPAAQQPMRRSVQMASTVRALDRRSVSMPAQDEIEQGHRLQAVCQLLRSARHPLCPVNGVVVVVGLDLFSGNDDEFEQLHRGVRSDVLTIQRTLELRAPTTVVVSNCDRDPGFRELMRRVGRERAAKHRFGHSFDVRSAATYDALNVFAERVCGVFEDWIYSLFRESDALTRPGNTRLQGLLCHVRSELKERLARVLSGGFGYLPERGHGDDVVHFSGCYFVANGARDDRHAFVRGIVDKLAREQEEVEWTDRAERDDRRHAVLVNVGIGVALLLTVSAGVLLYLGLR